MLFEIRFNYYLHYIFIIIISLFPLINQAYIHIYTSLYIAQLLPLTHLRPFSREARSGPLKPYTQISNNFINIIQTNRYI